MTIELTEEQADVLLYILETVYKRSVHNSDTNTFDCFDIALSFPYDDYPMITEIIDKINNAD